MEEATWSLLVRSVALEVVVTWWRNANGRGTDHRDTCSSTPRYFLRLGIPRG